MRRGLGAAAGRLALLAVSWLALAALSSWLFEGASRVAALWLPGGVALAALDRSGKRWWPSLAAVGLAAAAFEGFRGGSPVIAIWRSLVHVGEPALAALMLRHWRTWRPNPPEAGRGAILVLALPGSLLAAAALELPARGLGQAWALPIASTLGHLVGTVLVTSLVWAWRGSARPELTPRAPRILEAAFVLGGIWALSRWVFASALGASPLGLFPFSVLPLLVWATLRLGSRGASLGSLLLSAEALRHVAAGRGPFVLAGDAAEAGLIETQCFVAVLCFTTLVLAGTLEGRDKAIRALRQSETALQRERTLVREAEAAVHVGSWHLDLTTGRIKASEEARRLLELAPVEEGRPVAGAVAERVHPDDREGVLGLLAALRSGERIPTSEFRVLLPDGTERSLRAEAGRVARDASGQPRHVYGVIEDVTEKRRLETALRESEDRYRGVFEDSASVMLVLEPDGGRVVDANPAACAFYGRARDELRALSLFELSALPTAEVAGLLAEAARGRQTSFECRHRAAGGEIREVIEHCGPVRVGTKTLLHTVVHDVTEVRRAEEEARRGMYEATARLRGVIDATPLGVVMLGDDLRVRLANPAAAQLLGGAGGIIVGATIERLLGSDAALTLTGPVLHGESLSAVEIEHVRADGTHVALRAFGAPLRLPEGHLRGAVLLFEDATERRLVDETLQLAQKLEVLATVAGGVAHDFNNLLTVVLGHSERALRKLPADSPARSHLERALPAVEQAIAVAGQLLVYAGGSRPVVGPLDIGRLVREERAMLAATVPAHVVLDIVLPERLPSVEASAEEIRQALTALLANAVEAIGGRRGRVRLSMSTHQIAEGETVYSRYTGAPLAGGEYLSLEVEDDGSGIQSQSLPRIFDPFFTTKFVGRGLGLAAVLGIVRSHRGGIAVDSTPGRGSRFAIVLPVMTPAGGGEREEPRQGKPQENLPTPEPLADQA